MKLAGAYGVHPTARALGLDYNSLRNRVESASRSAGGPPANPNAFLDLSASVGLRVPECILELEDVQGTKMRVHFRGIEAPDLAALTRRLWGIE